MQAAAVPGKWLGAHDTVKRRRRSPAPHHLQVEQYALAFAPFGITGLSAASLQGTITAIVRLQKIDISQRLLHHTPRLFVLA